ncbi:MAG: hypothetical protein WCH37_06755 [Synechococcaceae cyanobacterium ELA182]
MDPRPARSGGLPPGSGIEALLTATSCYSGDLNQIVVEQALI